LTLQEACGIASKDRERIETALKEEVMCDQYECPNCLEEWDDCTCAYRKKKVVAPQKQDKTPAAWVKTLGKLQVDVLQHNCSNCKDTVCARQGDKNYICSGWCDDLKKKEGTTEKKCSTCKHRTGSIWKPVCKECEWWPYKTGKNNWEADLPEKHENLTWHEADKLWHEGWEMSCVSLVRDARAGSWNFDTMLFEVKTIRATDWYVAGRRKT
jgi:hypothetical protein